MYGNLVKVLFSIAGVTEPRGKGFLFSCITFLNLISTIIFSKVFWVAMAE